MCIPQLNCLASEDMAVFMAFLSSYLSMLYLRKGCGVGFLVYIEILF